MVQKFLMSGNVKQTLLDSRVSPPNFEWFLLIYQSVVDFEDKRNIEASTVVEVWLLLCLNHIFNPQKRSLVCKMTMHDLRVEGCMFLL